MTLNPGDRVRLTDQCAKTFNRISRSQVDWTTRVGTVKFVSRYEANVLWDGCRTTDHWPQQALQKDSP